jgi:hypothetical protein
MGIKTPLNSAPLAQILLADRRSHQTLAATVRHQFASSQAKSSPGEAKGHRGETARGLGLAGESLIKPRAIAEDQSNPATITRYPPVTTAARDPP